MIRFRIKDHFLLQINIYGLTILTAVIFFFFLVQLAIDSSIIFVSKVNLSKLDIFLSFIDKKKPLISENKSR